MLQVNQIIPKNGKILVELPKKVDEEKKTESGIFLAKDTHGTKRETLVESKILAVSDEAKEKGYTVDIYVLINQFKGESIILENNL